VFITKVPEEPTHVDAQFEIEEFPILFGLKNDLYVCGFPFHADFRYV